MLVLSVGVLIGIILFPLQRFRQVEAIQTSHGPSFAVWMVVGGVAGALMVLALAFLIIYPAGIAQEFRLFYLVIMMLVAAGLRHVLKDSVTILNRPTLLLGFASALILMIYFTSHFMQLTEDDGKLFMGVAGILFVLIGMSLPAMQSSLMHDDSKAAWVDWWWWAMAAGGATALFWSMRLYSALGDSLLLIAGLLLSGLAGIFCWHTYHLREVELEPR